MEKIIEDDEGREMTTGSSSSEGKMVIKLKIPKLITEGEKSPENDVIGISTTASSKPEGKRVCLECNKEFSSGKALGGHMRIHVQALKTRNPNFLKPSKTTKFKKTGDQDFNNGDENGKGKGKPYYMNSVNDEGKPTCSQCGKTFPSMKSLFGHMRCHPERIWRGILPPPNTPTTTTSAAAAAARRRSLVGNNNNNKLTYSSDNSGSSLSENDLSIDDGVTGGDQVVDLTKFLRGWSVTERRGRKSLKPDEDDDVLLEAVEDLLSLANGGGGSMTEYSGVNSNSLTNKDSQSDQNSPSVTRKIIKRRKKMKLMLELESKQEQNDDVPEQQPDSDECKYKCTTCNKCFGSHQALGGHRSSHNKSRLDHNYQIEENDSSLMNQSGETLEKELIEVAGSGIHQCKICNKTFATGQALGGHKRSHWIGTNEAQVEAVSSQITSTGEAGSSGRKVLDFDLNEIPPVTMMEEEESANANGYASSSYNSNMG